LIVKNIEKEKENIKKILDIDHSTFDENLLNEWQLVTYIRFGRVFCLYEIDSLKGFAIFMRDWDDPKSAYLVKIAIDNENQGKGYGCYLLLKSLLSLKEDKFTEIHLTCDPKNEKARHIYCDKFGFELVEFRKNEYGEGHDRLVLRLDLDNWTPSLDENLKIFS
jgi:[ribosomal protein S18]-alanine N-acetyltransferase